MRIYPLLIFLFLFQAGKSQFVMGKINKDSLLKVVQLNKEDTGTVNAYISLGRYFRSRDPQKSLEYSMKAEYLSRKINFPKGRAKAENNIAVYYIGQNKNDSAFRHYALALQAAVEAKDAYQEGLEYLNAGQAYYDISAIDAALDNFIKSDSIGEKIENKYLTLASLNAISGIYFSDKNYVRARAYTQRMLDYGAHSNDNNTIAAAYNNFGNFSDAEGKYREALSDYFHAVDLYGDKGMLQLPQLYSNISSTYYKIGKYDSSIYAGKKGVAIRSKMVSPADYAVSMKNIGASMLKLGNSDSALAYALHGLELAESAHFPSVEADLHALLSEIYSGKKDFENALFHSQKYADLQDSVNRQLDANARNRMLARFDVAKKEQDLELAKAERKKDRIILVVVCIGGLFVLLLLLNRYQIKRKANKNLEAKNEMISAQNDEISLKNKEITDSINYARRIQNGILPDERMLNEAAPDNFVLNIPRDIVSGDFYWFAKKENRFYIAVADCTGHGVPGALLSVVGINLLNQVIAQPGLPSTSEVLQQLHELIIKALNKNVNSRETNDGMDIGLLCIDETAREAEFTGARRPLFISTAEGVEMIKGDRDSVGGETINDQPVFSVHKKKLGPQQVFYLTTDGFVDQFGESSNKKFLTKRFHDLLGSFRDIPVKEQKEMIGTAFAQWKGNLEQVDDVLVLGLRI
jgi:serine phosphatase RsbU (regulator of sigma subunit)